MTQDEALKLARDALEKSWNPALPSAERERVAKEAITAIKEALAIEIAAGSQAFYGFPHGPGGKCVTAGETAPKEIDPNQWAFDNGLEST